MKKIITAIILLISSTVFAQTKISDLPIATGKGIGLFVPTVQAGSTKKISLDSLFKNATNYADSLKVLTDAGIAGNAANILLKLNKSDTAAMLFPYALKSLLSFDSTVLSSKDVASFTKNSTLDSAILLLNNGTRYAVKDNVGGGGAASSTDSLSYHFVTPLADSTGFVLTRPNFTKDTIKVNLGPGLGTYVPMQSNIPTLNSFPVTSSVFSSQSVSIPPSAIGPVTGIVLPHLSVLNYGGILVSDQEGTFFSRKNNGASAWNTIVTSANIATYAPPSTGVLYNGSITTLNSFVSPPTAFAGTAPTNNPPAAIGAVTGIALPHPSVAGYGGLIVSDQGGVFFIKANNTSTTWGKVLTDQNISGSALISTNGIPFENNANANNWTGHSMYYSGATNIPSNAATNIVGLNFPISNLSTYGNQMAFEQFGKLYTRNNNGGTFGAWKGIAQYLEASATYIAPSIAASGTTTTTVSIPGAVLGNYAHVSFSISLQGIMATAYVSAADVVTVVLFNPTATAIVLASTTIKVKAE
jgi:hypothetical protein